MGFIWAVLALTPVLMDYLEKRGVLKRYPWINLPVQTAFCGVVLIFTTPLACAFFKQKAQIAYRKLEPELKVKRFLCDLVEPWIVAGAIR